MKFDAHAGLNPIGKAAQKCKYDIAFLPLNMHPFLNLLGIDIPKDSVFKRVEYIFAHYAFFFQAFGNCRKDLLIVREFLTIPLLLAWPFYFLFKRKLLFIVNHNLQKAHASKIEGLAFKTLLKLGMRPLFLDTEVGVKELGVSLLKNHYLVLPHPIAKIYKKDTSSEKFTVGIIGDNRKEKKIGNILEDLYQACSSLDMQLLIGSADKHLLNSWEGKGIKLIDTTSAEDYIQAFLMSDVVVLNYDRAAYFYRISGVVCDAVSAGTAVICPDFPVFAEQISRLGKIGMRFTDKSNLANLLSSMRGNYQDFQMGLSLQQSARTEDNLVFLLEGYIEKNS